MYSEKSWKRGKSVSGRESACCHSWRDRTSRKGLWLLRCHVCSCMCTHMQRNNACSCMCTYMQCIRVCSCMHTYMQCIPMLWQYLGGQCRYCAYSTPTVEGRTSIITIYYFCGMRDGTQGLTHTGKVMYYYITLLYLPRPVITLNTWFRGRHGGTSLQSQHLGRWGRISQVSSQPEQHNEFTASLRMCHKKIQAESLANSVDKNAICRFKWGAFQTVSNVSTFAHRSWSNRKSWKDTWKATYHLEY